MLQHQLIKSVVQTCSACPSQWDVELADGTKLYVRYRWGWLTVSPDDDVLTNLYEAQLGDKYDGVLSEEDMTLHLCLWLADPSVR